MNIKGFSDAEKMREESLFYREKIEKKGQRKRKKKLERKYKKIVKQIQNDINEAKFNGKLSWVSIINTADIINNKQRIYDYFSSKGYEVEISCDTSLYGYPYFKSFVYIDWHKKRNAKGK
jgi:hypothetical protein